MHGVNRDAERYLNDWIPLAEKHKFVVIAPEFTRKDFPKDADYSQGAAMDENGQARPREQMAFILLNQYSIRYEPSLATERNDTNFTDIRLGHSLLTDSCILFPTHASIRSLLPTRVGGHCLIRTSIIRMD